MKKKTKRTKQVAKTKAAKKSTAPKKPKDTEKVREEIAGMVKAGAKQMARAVIGHASNGDLAQVKYLFEMAGIFPKPAEGDGPTEQEDCLAKMLLDKIEKEERAEETAKDAKLEAGIEEPAEAVGAAETVSVSEPQSSL